MTSYTPDQWQEAITGLASSGLSFAPPNDLSATGTISAAQPVINTPVTNATVALAVGTGQSTWKAQLLAGGGGFTSGTTIVADKSPDGGTTWYSASFKVSGASPATPVSSVVGPAPVEMTGNVAGVTHVRLRCSVLNSTETVAVTLRASTGIAEVGLISSVPAGSNVMGGVTIADGSATTIGAIADAAVTNPASSGSVVALLKGLLTRIGATLGFDNTNELKTSLYAKNSAAGDTAVLVDASGRVAVNVNTLPALVAGSAVIGSTTIQAASGTALVADQSNTEIRVSTYGKNSAAGDTPLAVDSGGRALTSNYIGGSAVGTNNPYPTSDQIRLWIVNGQGFSVTTGKQTSLGSLTTALAIFNPSGSTKTMYVYSAKLMEGSSNFHTLTYTTTDPAYANSLTPVNTKAGSGTTTQGTASWLGTSATITGTVMDTIGLPAAGFGEFLGTGVGVLVLPPGNGVTMGIVTATNNWVASFKWVEV